VLAGYIRWTDYRGREAPTAIRVFHHKTGAIVLHPLQDADGTLFYADAESILAKLPRRGIPMILHETRDKTAEGKPKPTELYSASGMAKLVRSVRVAAGLPSTFTLDACRHGGMTELELAGAGGFEPPNGGIKIRCLTTWLRPNAPSDCRRPAAGHRRAQHSGAAAIDQCWPRNRPAGGRQRPIRRVSHHTTAMASLAFWRA
jgi:hypothetical protein